MPCAAIGAGALDPSAATDRLIGHGALTPSNPLTLDTTLSVTGLFEAAASLSRAAAMAAVWAGPGGIASAAFIAAS
jgi:hypothetical protein